MNFNIYFLLQRETDGLKIKTKMLEDQTETIRKFKEVRNNTQTQRGKKQYANSKEVKNNKQTQRGKKQYANSKR